MSDPKTRVRLGAWAGIIGPIAYVATWALAGQLRPGYDPVRQAISELAEIGATTQPWMTAAFVVFGLTALPFAAALRSLPGDTRPLVAAVIICGLATVGAGIFPCTAGCPGAGSSLTDDGHAVTAIVGYLALMAAPALAARLLWTTERAFARWSLGAAVVGSVAMLAWTLGLFGASGGAGQRGFNTLADVWWASAGVLLLRRAAQLGRPTLVSDRHNG